MERDISGCGLGSVLHLPTQPSSIKQSLFPRSLKNQRGDGHAGKLRQTKVMIEVALFAWQVASATLMDVKCVVTMGAASLVALWTNPRFSSPRPLGAL